MDNSPLPIRAESLRAGRRSGQPKRAGVFVLRGRPPTPRGYGGRSRPVLHRAYLRVLACQKAGPPHARPSPYAKRLRGTRRAARGSGPGFAAFDSLRALRSSGLAGTGRGTGLPVRTRNWQSKEGRGLAGGAKGSSAASFQRCGLYRISAGKASLVGGRAAAPFLGG